MRPTTSPRRAGHARRVGATALALTAVAAVGLPSAAIAKARSTAAKPSVGVRPWGKVNGQPVFLYTLSNGHMRVRISNFGGIVQSIDTPGKNGKLNNITLGFPNLAGYQRNDVYPQPSGGSGTTYFGATIGRYANRIANGTFKLNGVTYTLPKNNGPNTLHGGTDAWNQQVWAPSIFKSENDAGLSLTYTSPDGQDGFPGTVVATVRFTLTAKNTLRIRYHATTDKPTVINMTNHTYFNLDGQASGSIYGQKLMINANRYTPTDATAIPTGRLAPVAGTPMDFRVAKPIGRDITSPFQQLILAHGYDHNWVITGGGKKLTLAAKAEDPASGRTVTAYTTEPGVQVYTGNFLVGDLVGTTYKTYRQGAGFTLETQHFPDSPNEPSFPSTTLNPGTPFNSLTTFHFGTATK